MISNFEDYAPTFSYIFTKYSPEDNIYAILLNIFDSQTVDEKNDGMF